MTHLLISSRLAATHPTLRSSDAVNVLFKPLQRKQLLMPSKLSSDNGTLLCKDCDKQLEILSLAVTFRRHLQKGRTYILPDEI